MVKAIAVGHGLEALVDDDVFDALSQFSWHICASSNKKPYACRKTPRGVNKQTTVRMHRQLLDAPDDVQVDHINGNSLDNRRENLRLCSLRQNCRNRKKVRIATTSKFKGVDWFGRKGRWRVRIMVDRKAIFVGEFDREEDAALAYNLAATKYHGEFALYNHASAI